MATKLKKMRLTSVDLVRAGANQEADICLFKSADPPSPTESPTEDEKNIFKRFIAWLQNNPTEAQNEPHSPIEKADDAPDLEFIYKSALTESLNSIMADESLTTVEKKSMAEESLRQYAEKIRELERDEEDYDSGDDDTIEEELAEEVVENKLKKAKKRPKLLWDIDDPENAYDAESVGIDIDEIEEIDEIDEVEKFNPYHDRSGRFSSAGGGGGGGASSGGSAGTTGNKKPPIPKSAVSVNTTTYEFTHGKPKGNGQWAFKIGGKTVFFNGKNSDAKKQAIAHAAKNGEWSVKLET